MRSLNKTSRRLAPSARTACTLAIAALMLAGTSVEAYAQDRRFDITGFAGVRTFAADSALGEQNLGDVKVQNSVIFGPRAHFKVAPMFFIEGEFPLLISKTSYVEDTLLVFFLHPRVQALFAPLPNGTVQPALLAGVGLASSDFITDREIVPQGHLGLAVRVPNRFSWNARLDARWVVGPTREGGGAIANEFEILLSVYRPEPTPRTERPTRPTTSDSDNDGIIDREDECPDEPEDEDGFEDEDGCPDTDNDADAIADADDQCPIEPETKNNYKDEDGCPDEVPTEIQSFTGKIDGIQFEYNSATLTPESFPVLDGAVEKLKEFSDLEVVIVGHTDDQGSDDYNIELSQKRADTVMRYLISRGIERSRLEAVGMGKNEPLVDNDTEEGRATNRRVEFNIK